ncbi:MAG: winged helix-turn-helix domain-containing protein [Candidatus Anstonellaceae archaeon]
MDSKSRLLFWLLAASKGGPTRIKILNILCREPSNVRRLSLILSMEYKTIKTHIELMLKYGLIDAIGSKYGRIYYISPEWEKNEFLKKLLRGEKNGVKKN